MVVGGGRVYYGGMVDCLDYQIFIMDGIGIGVRFNYFWGIVFDVEDNVFYVGDCVSRYIVSYVF